MHQKITQLLTTTLNIIDYNKLNEYVNFCIENNTEPIKFKTARHHILPQANFPQFKNLKFHPWNSSNLSHQHHYISHYLLAQAIDNSSIIYAWNSMKNKDSKRYDIDIFESSAEYEKLKIRTSIQFSKDANTIESNGLTKAQNRGKKCSKTLTTIQSNGKTIAQTRAKLANITRSKINPSTGLTFKQESITKMSKTKIKNGLTKGANAPSARKAIILNNRSELVAFCHGNIHQTCKLLGLPRGEITKTIGKSKFYQNLSKKSITQLTNNGNIIFRDWSIVFLDTLHFSFKC